MAYGVCDNLGDMWFLTNQVDSATLTGASVTPELGVERLKDPRIGKKWRTPFGGATLTITFASAVPVQCFAIFGLSPVFGTTFTLAMGTTVGGSDIRAGVWDPDVDNRTRQAFWLNAVERPGLTAPLLREIRLGVASATAAIEIGRAWAGDYVWTPTVSQAPGSDQGSVDMSSVQRTRRGGAVLADAAKIQRTATIQYNAIPQAEWDDEVYTITMTAGQSKQLLYIPSYERFAPYRNAILGHQEALNPIAALAYDRYTKTFVLREDG